MTVVYEDELRNGETQGIWGGKTRNQRAALLRRTT